MPTTRSGSKKANKNPEKQKRLRSSAYAMATATPSSAKKAKGKKKGKEFDIDSFLAGIEADEISNGESILDKSGKSVEYSKQQLKIEQRFRSDLVGHYGE